jgi:anti-sigma B factor antagonist
METLECHLEVLSDAHVLHIRGEVDLWTADRFRTSLEPIVGNGHHLILDMSKLDYLDGSGMRFLFLAQERSRANGETVLVAGASPVIRRLLEIVNVDMPVLPTVADALERLRGRGEDIVVSLAAGR